MKAAELCAGYSGLLMAMRQAGWPVELAWVAEVDPEPSKVLAARHPNVPNIGDITTADFTSMEPVDVVAAGFPCTDVSAAGKMAGLIGDRVIPAGEMACGCQWGDHQVDTCDAASPGGLVPSRMFAAGLLEEAALAIADLNRIDRASDGPPPERLVKGTRTGVWTHVARAIKELQPKIVLLENVRGLLSARAHSDLEPCPWCVGDEPDEPSLRALGAVLGDLADLGYDAVWKGVPASAVGAPHQRWRVFILAWPAADADETGRGTSLGDLLPGQPDAAGRGVSDRGVTLLPTPAARDWKSGQSNVMDRNARPLNEVVVNLLPTPRTSDTNGAGIHGSGGPDLRTVVSLLPTPTQRLGATGGNPERGGRASRTSTGADLADAVVLLPTPMAADGGADRGSSAGFGLRNTSRQIPDRWGVYGPAIERWEAAIGRCAPEPTEPGSKGQPRLNPRFVEWLMGLPDGWVTDILARSAALKCLGNGVVPQQGAAAIRLLSAYLPYVLLAADPAEVAA